MRVLFVTGTSVVWGAEQSLLAVAQALATAGIEVELACGLPDLSSRWRERGLGAVYDVASSRGRLDRVAHYARALKAIRPPDAVLVWDLYLIPLLPALKIQRRWRRTKFIADIHDSRAANWRRIPYFALLPLYNHVICVSQYIKSQLFVQKGATVIHRPVPSRGLAKRSESDSLNVGVVGQIAPHKQVDRALPIVGAARGATLVVRGAWTDDNRAYGSDLVERGRMKLGRRFRFDGQVAPDRLYDGLDILLFLNTTEPSGRVIAEAQLAGVFPLVPNRGGAVEFVESGLTGFIYSTDEDAIEQLNRLHEYPISVDRIRDMVTIANKAYSPHNRGLEYASVLLGLHCADASTGL